MNYKPIKLRMIYLTLSILVAIVLIVTGCMSHPKFGKQARGARLARIEQSPNYRNGTFHNLEPTPQLTSEKSRARTMYDFLFEKRERNRPSMPLPAIKSNLKSLNKYKDLIVWFGHSSYFIQSAGLRMLIDPVFEDAAPLSFFNKPFKGTDIYKADDMPEIDYLVITHDHWDHLDYTTVSALCQQVQHVICPLGVGQHFEHWGYTPHQIIEMDWNEQHQAENNFTIHCLPARHFSGRTFRSNRTLWASYMLATNTQTIYLSGDSGYGIHYNQIAQRFPHIDLAIMENGQYNQDWRYIHLMPQDLRKAIEELNPKKALAGHNSKYALSKHPWDEPLEHASTLPSIVMPKIGEVMYLQDSIGSVKRWWASATSIDSK